MILCVQVEQCAVKMDARPYLVSPFNMKDPPQEEACRANSFMYWFNFSILIILQPSLCVLVLVSLLVVVLLVLY